MQGRRDEAGSYSSACLLCNDLGLLSEEYDPAAKRLLGNFPQAFTHVGSSTRRTTCRRMRPERAARASILKAVFGVFRWTLHRDQSGGSCLEVRFPCRGDGLFS